MLNVILKDIKSIIISYKEKFFGSKKQFLVEILPYLIIFFISNRFFYLINKLGFYVAFKYFSSILGVDMPIFPLGKYTLYAIGTSILIKFLIQEKIRNAKNFRKGIEYGSARWGTEKEIKEFINNEDEDQNIILTNTEKLTMVEELPFEKVVYNRNKNVLVIGGSGSGKTLFYVKPNLMQMHSSYVVTDPKGTLILETGKMLEKGVIRTINGKQYRDNYKIKSFNTINFSKSMHYNPFKYVKTEKDILKLVTTIIANTKGEGDKSGEDFWVKAEKLLYNALISYIVFELPLKDRNFGTLIDMIDNSKTSEDDENFKNIIDKMFEQLEEIKGEIFSVRQYKKYKLAAGKTAKSILISCGARLAPFDIQELKEIMSYDELELDKIGDRKTALFIIMSDTDTTFSFVIAMLYSQLFNLLCDKADDVYNGKLPVHVRCIIDEFANIALIPNFDKLIATIRSRRISATVVLQALSQLKTLYKDSADTIIGNCDTTIFLGGKEKTTLKELEELLGKETVDLFNTSESRGREKSSSLSYQKVSRSLMSQDEIAVMPGNKCILQIRGVRPFLSDKFKIQNHKRYKELKKASDKDSFDIKKYKEKLPKKKVNLINNTLKNNTKLKTEILEKYIKENNIKDINI